MKIYKAYLKKKLKRKKQSLENSLKLWGLIKIISNLGMIAFQVLWGKEISFRLKQTYKMQNKRKLRKMKRRKLKI